MSDPASSSEMKLSVAILAAAFLLGCHSDPDNSFGLRAMSQIVEGQSGKGIAVKSFAKTNGIKREVAGQRIYTLEFSGVLSFTRAGWKGGDAIVGKFNDFSLVDKRPSGFEAFGRTWYYYDAGDEVEVTGDITFEDTEKGWRPTQHNIKAYRILTSKKERFQGVWKGGKILTDVLIIGLQDGGTFAIRELPAMDNADFRSVGYENGVIRGTFHIAVDSDVNLPFEIRMKDENTIVYKDERGEDCFSRQR